MRKILFQLHWIVGITAGLVLAVVGTTGALLSFEQQFIAFIDHDARYVEEGGDNLLTAPELLARLATAYPEKQVSALTIARLPFPSVRVVFASSGARGEQRYVNPYTGALIAVPPSGADAFFRDVRQLHRWLMLGDLGDRDIGRQIVGASTILLLFMTFTGLYLRWPRGPAARRWRTWLLPNFQLKGRAFLWNLHSVIGTWVLPIYLVIALTGLQWSYEWYRNGLYSIAGVERPAGGPEGSRAQRPATMDITDAWSTFERVTATKFTSVTVNMNARPERTIEFRYLDAHPNHDRAFNTLAVDARGEIVRHERYRDKELAAQLVASIFPLHSGSYFGLIGTVLFLLASLAMPLFSLTGWIMYVQRRTSRVRRTTLATAADEA